MVKAKRKDTRRKKNHKFQLNINRDVELWLHEKIDTLTKERKFSQYVRDGLSLMIYFAEWGIAAQSVYDLFVELRQGKKDKLYQMFPHLEGQIGQGAPTPQPPPLDTQEFAKEVATQIILQGGDPTKLMRQPSTGHQPDSPAKGGLKSLTNQQFAMPVFEELDDEPTVIINKSMDTSSGLNFTRSLQGLQ